MNRDLRHTHTFERYFQDGITRVDRLDQVLRYGILSQREAQKNGIPFKRNLNIRMLGARDYDDIIFLHTIGQSFNPVWVNGTTVLINPGLETLSIEEMIAYQKGNWTVASRGEAYRLGRIEPAYFDGIILPTQDELEETKRLLQNYLPKDPGRIKLMLPENLFKFIKQIYIR